VYGFLIYIFFSRHRTTRSRSPQRSSTTRADRTARTDRKPEETRYQETSSSRDRSTRRDDYYDSQSRSSTRPHKDQIQSYGTSSSAYTNPPVQQTNRYEQPIKDTTTVYEKRLAAMNDTYGSGGVNHLTASYSRDLYSDRKKDTYGDSYGTSASGGASLSYDQTDLGTRYAASSSSYNRTLAPATDISRFEKLYPQSQSYSTPIAQAAGAGWPRQSDSEYPSSTNTNPYNVNNPNVQYEFMTRRF